MYGHVITKFSRMGSLQHFFTHGAPLRASRARAPLLDLDSISVQIVCNLKAIKSASYINYMYFDRKNCVKKFRSQFKRKRQTSWQNGVETASK